MPQGETKTSRNACERTLPTHRADGSCEGDGKTRATRIEGGNGQDHKPPSKWQQLLSWSIGRKHGEDDELEKARADAERAIAELAKLPMDIRDEMKKCEELIRKLT